MAMHEAIQKVRKARLELAQAVMKFDRIVDAATPLMDDELTEERVQFIREIASTGVHSRVDLAKEFKISPGYLSRILSGKHKKGIVNVTS
jgi:DNA-binding MarR family transcriptional regulator